MRGRRRQQARSCQVRVAPSRSDRRIAPQGYEANALEAALWAALCAAPEQGSDIAELMRATGMGRSTVYRYLAQFAEDGRAVQAGWGRWRAAYPEEPHDE